MVGVDIHRNKFDKLYWNCPNCGISNYMGRGTDKCSKTDWDDQVRFLSCRERDCLFAYAQKPESKHNQYLVVRDHPTRLELLMMET